ncbi:MAG: ATP/GTP-binding protein [Thermus sp.]|nr:ATP/GTP-binding protein [Thermus sp.]
MNRPLKLVVSGPVGSGKTTFIQSLSEIPVVETDEWASEEIGKEKTTVALDYGLLTLDGVPIHLYGTPGQERFNFIWDVLVEGALGLVLLVAGDRPGDFPKARHILEYLTSRHPVPFVVGVTRQDLERVWRPEEVADFFGLPSEQVVGMNATSPTSATLALIRILELVTASK